MVELLLQLPSIPGPNSTVIMDGAKQDLGGPALNICWNLSKLGHTPHLVGIYGLSDESFVEKALSDAKIEQSGLIKIDNYSDKLISILTPQAHHSIYLRTKFSERIGDEFFNKCASAQRLVLVGSRHSILRTKFLSLAKGFKGELLAYNPSYAIYEYEKFELEQLITKTDVMILNEQEGKHACQLLNVGHFPQLPRKKGAILIVTKGENGASIYRDNFHFDSKSIVRGKKEMTIGAGDAYFSGFLHAIFNGKSIEDAATFGSALAGHVVQSSKVRTEFSEFQIRQELLSKN